MRKLLLMTALATVGFAASANATLVSLAFTPYGNGISPPAAPPGEVGKPISSASLTGTEGIDYELVTGSMPNMWAAPAYPPAGAPDPLQYLAVETGQSTTFSLGGSYTGVEIYVGSLDSYNKISFSNTLSYSGADLAAMTAAVDDGNQTLSTRNGLFYFVFSPDEAVTSVTFASSGNSLEVAGLSASNSVPEPSTWAMMALGFAGLGYAAFRRNAKGRLAAVA